MASGQKATNHGPVLVVGATPDYAQTIHEQMPGRAVFLMRKAYTNSPMLAVIPGDTLIFAPFHNYKKVLQALRSYFSKDTRKPDGIACFDCDALVTASKLSCYFNKPFADLKTVSRCRNKFLTKYLWTQAGVNTAPGILCASIKESSAFLRDHPAGVVIKPVTGGGSELVFLCLTEKQTRDTVSLLLPELKRRRSKDLFKIRTEDEDGTGKKDPCLSWIVEAYLPGPEFSCDFLLQSGTIRIVRLTGKVKAGHEPFGTILAYTYPAILPDGVIEAKLAEALQKAVAAIGFQWGHFMADFIIKDSRIFMIELSPRPGGDSIPDLVETATGQNLLGLHLDFVSGQKVDWPVGDGRCYASFHFYASSEGRIDDIDASKLFQYPAVRKIVLRKKSGDKVVLPPRNYSSRLLGYCIAETPRGVDLLSEHHRLSNLLHLSYKIPTISEKNQQERACD